MKLLPEKNVYVNCIMETDSGTSLSLVLHCICLAGYSAIQIGDLK